jgi:tryptophan-rich sensory protein
LTTDENRCRFKSFTPKRKEIHIVQSIQTSARRRSMILAALIVVVTMFWALMLFNTNLPTLALAAIAVVSLALLAVATAWTAIAFPRRSAEQTSS